MLPIAGVLLVLMACGGGYFMLQVKKKKSSVQRLDLDADYTEKDEEYANPEEDEPDPIRMRETMIPSRMALRNRPGAILGRHEPPLYIN